MAAEFDAERGVAGVLVRGVAGRLGLAGAGAPAATGPRVVAAGVPERVRSVADAGINWATGGTLPLGPAEGETDCVRPGDALGRVVAVAGASELALELSGSRMAPAKVSGRRELPDMTMVTMATVLIVTADIDNQKVGGRTAGMPEWCHAFMAKVSNEST
jgi:hypothetical protein